MSAADQLQTRRALRIILVLAGHEVRGLRTGEIAAAIKESPSTTTRMLAAMVEEGVVEEMPDKKDGWCLGPKLIQIALAHTRGLTRTAQRVSEVTQRYSRTP
jgi:DNA-binding IclR family transcriptional regulator